MRKNKKTFLELLAISIFFMTFAFLALFIFKQSSPTGFADLTGRVMSTVYVHPAVPATCNTTIQPGLNLISFFCISTVEDLDYMTETIPQYDYIFTYDSSDSKDPWKAYKPGLPAWVITDIRSMSRKNGYWIQFQATSPTNLYINGSKRIPTEIDIRQGTNLAGYPTNVVKEIATALDSINGSYEIVYSYDNKNNNYQYYNSSGNGTLNETAPYKGYWIIANNTGKWVVDW